MDRLIVKNWTKFQHYKERRPPWIKLATDIFQNYEFSRLQSASKLLAICIWTLASRSNDGSVPNDFEFIRSQGCLDNFIKAHHLQELIDKGFICRASNVLATCYETSQDCAMPETETETETETDLTPSALKKGTRIPFDFKVTSEHRTWAAQNFAASPDDHIEEFRDYWKSRPGAGGVKLDWDATFRNWLRKAGKGNHAARKPSILSVVQQAIG